MNVIGETIATSSDKIQPLALASLFLAVFNLRLGLS